jgi:phage tail sheath protein FI
MPVKPTYPGVYIEEIPSGAHPITGVATSIGAFIDSFPQGPLDTAVHILSLADFERYFGGLSTTSEASYGIQQFFLNGGSEAYVVRVGDGSAIQTAAVILEESPGGTEVATVSAGVMYGSNSVNNPGAWGNRIRLEVDYNTPDPTQLFNLTVVLLDATTGQAVQTETFRNLTFQPGQPTYAPDAVNQGSRLVQLSPPPGSTSFPDATTWTSAYRPDSTGTLGSGLPMPPVIPPASSTFIVVVDPDGTGGSQYRQTVQLNYANPPADYPTLRPLLEKAIQKAAVGAPVPNDPLLAGASVQLLGSGTATVPYQFRVLAGRGAGVNFNPNAELSFKDFPGNTSSAQALTITVEAGVTVATTSLPNGNVGTPYNATLAASGANSPANWALAAGTTLPAGLNLSATGQITGTPTTAGVSNFSVTVTDNTGPSAAKQLMITIAPAVSIATTALPNASMRTTYNATLAASGANTPFTWSLAGGTALPAGLNLSAAGQITGTPTTAGVSNFSVTVTDNVGETSSAPLQITVESGVTVATTSLPNGSVGAPYSATLTASGVNPPLTGWGVTAAGGSLPAGLTLNPKTGQISGMPTAAATSTFSVTVTDNTATSAAKQLTITIGPAVSIATTALPNASMRTTYNATLAASGVNPPFGSWTVSAGALPAGLTLNPATGQISGTPTAAGASNFSVTVMDHNSAEALGLATAQVEVQQYSLGSGSIGAQTQTGLPAGLGSGNDGGTPPALQIIGDQAKKTGLFALENADLFNILCIPLAANLSSGDFQSIITEATAYCDHRRAFLIVDIPNSVADIPTMQSWMSQNDTLRDTNNAIYFPRVLIPDPLNSNRLRNVAPSGTIAGLYAATDVSRGVWKAPAGTEAALRNVSQLAYKMSDGENGVLNPLGINCLRNFPIYGNVCWGARTLDGADVMSSDWKYIPVRRLALFLEESLYRGTKWAVFEPNDEPLWAQIRLSVGSFMQSLFRQGAFQGSTPQQAYLVKCDKETTTALDQANGIVNIVVGFAPLKPAEFVIIQIQQLAGQLIA